MMISAPPILSSAHDTLVLTHSRETATIGDKARLHLPRTPLPGARTTRKSAPIAGLHVIVGYEAQQMRTTKIMTSSIGFKTRVKRFRGSAIPSFSDEPEGLGEGAVLAQQFGVFDDEGL